MRHNVCRLWHDPRAEDKVEVTTMMQEDYFWCTSPSSITKLTPTPTSSCRDYSMMSQMPETTILTLERKQNDCSATDDMVMKRNLKAKNNSSGWRNQGVVDLRIQ